LGVATAVPVTGDVTISNTGATTIEPNAVTSAKISDDTITDDDINSAAAIQTTKIKGFYTGFWKKSINGSSYPITLSDLSIPPGSITDNSIIIFQTNTPGTDVLSSTPIKTPLNSPSYTEIKIEFSALVNTTIKLSYIIILNN
jgi:hypothetical protein